MNTKKMEIYTEEENLRVIEVGDIVYDGEKTDCQNYDNLSAEHTPFVVHWCATVEVEHAPHDWCDDRWKVIRVIENLDNLSEEVEVSPSIKEVEIGDFAFSDLEYLEDNTTRIIGVEITGRDIWKKYLVLDILEAVDGGN